MVQSLSQVFLKRADAPYAAGISPEHASYNEGIKAEALRRLLKFTLLAGGAGGGLGLLAHYLGKKSVPPSAADEPDVDLPYPQLDKASSALDLVMAGSFPAIGAGIGAAAGSTHAPRRPGAGALYGGTQGLLTGAGAGAGYWGGQRLAEMLAARLGGGNEAVRYLLKILGGAAGGTLAGRLSQKAVQPLMEEVAGPPPWRRKKADWADTAAHAVMPTTAGEPSPTVGSPRWLRGDSMTSLLSLPWFPAAMMAGGLGGFYGGNKLVRHILKRRREAELEKEVEEAKKEFEEAMMGQYDPQRLHSIGKAASAGGPLDRAADLLEKRGYRLNDLLGSAGGAYLLYALMAGGLSGYATHRFLKGRSKAKLLADAIKQRALVRSLSNPPDVYLHPVPAHLRGGQLARDEPTDPTASLPV